MFRRNFITVMETLKGVKTCERTHTVGGTFFGPELEHIYSLSTLHLRAAPPPPGVLEEGSSYGTVGSGRLAVIDRVEPVISV